MFEVKLKTDLTDLEELSRRYPEISRDVREAKVAKAILLLERAVLEGTPVGAGPIHLRDTIHHKVGISGKKVWGTLGTPAIRGESVEYGTKPHFPPTGPLTHWVERKLNIHGKRAERVAFAIALTIAKKGTKGAKMFEKGFDQSEAAMMRILEEIPAEIVRRIGR